MTFDCATQSTDPQNPKQPGWKIQKSCTTSLLRVTTGSTLHRNRSEKRRLLKNPKLGVPSQRGGGDDGFALSGGFEPFQGAEY